MEAAAGELAAAVLVKTGIIHANLFFLSAFVCVYA